MTDQTGSEMRLAMKDAMVEALRADDDFENMYGSRVLGKPGDGGYLYEGVDLAPPDRLDVRFRGGSRLTIAGLTRFDVSGDGFSVVDADWVGLEVEASLLLVARRDALYWLQGAGVEVVLERAVAGQPMSRCVRARLPA